MRTPAILAPIALLVAAAPVLAGDDPAAATPAIAPSASLVWDGSMALDGGREGAGAGRALVDAGVEFDLERLAGWARTRAFVGVQALDGRPGGALAGEFQSHSNIDAEPFEAFVGWIETLSRRERFRLRVGVMDANEEFGVAEAAAGFLNASAGVSPTISCLPTYPAPEPGAHVLVRAGGLWELAAGVHHNESHPSGGHGEAFWIGEVRRRAAGDERNSIALGAWRHEVSNAAARPTDGVYAVGERRLTRDGAARDARGWLVIGRSPDPEVEARDHVAAGITVRGLLPARGNDTTGLLVTWVGLRGDPGHGNPGETVVEWYHRIEPAPWLAIQPDLQWISSSGAAGGGPGDRLVGTLRLELSF